MYTAFYVLIALICAVLFAKVAEAAVIITKAFFKRVRG
ncbi:MAG: hypothetical protein QOH96_818 [Blastocatellia bacterium]|jgi:hypothetical protein|nr:hypothetical protein [Blastocatellia bacterium]